MSLNKVLLIGNVGKDPEVRHLESGAAVATFSLATSERYRGNNGEMKEITEWHNIVAWRQLADLASNYIKKGTQIYVEGRIRTRSWDDQSGQKRYTTEIMADAIQLLGRRSDNPGADQQPASKPTAQEAPQAYQPATKTAPAQQHIQSTPIISPEDLSADGSDDLPF